MYANSVVVKWMRIPAGLYPYPWSLWCTHNLDGVPVISMGVPVPLPNMGTVFTGMGRGSGKNTQGLPLSYLTRIAQWGRRGSYSLRGSHWFSGNPKRTQLESLGINLLQDMCLQCVLHVYYMWGPWGDGWLTMTSCHGTLMSAMPCYYHAVAMCPW